MNVSTLFRFCNIERFRMHVVHVSFNRSYVIHLAGHLRTAILSGTIYIACLSKDHTGNTMQTGAKILPFVRIKNFKNGQRYPVAHTHIAHIRDPPTTAPLVPQ